MYYLKDIFFFKKDKIIKLSKLEILTKRQLISAVPKVYDPIHILTPLVLRGRLLFSKACSIRPRLNWDVSLPLNLQKE